MFALRITLQYIGAGDRGNIPESSLRPKSDTIHHCHRLHAIQKDACIAIGCKHYEGRALLRKSEVIETWIYL